MMEGMQNCTHAGVNNLHNVVRAPNSKVFSTGVKLEVFNVIPMWNSRNGEFCGQL